LGLAIVKHIVENHRGNISVKSEMGQGTTFTVRLPKVSREDNAVRA
jgi:two-component system phosphate regulon sensor histidine kinase PhoR